MCENPHGRTIKNTWNRKNPKCIKVGLSVAICLLVLLFTTNNVLHHHQSHSLSI
jgi:hypothetical protein